MKKCLLVFLTLLVLVGCRQQANQSHISDPKVLLGQEAPAFVIKDQNGESVTWDDFKGKKTYINFWASWCQHCQKEIPDLVAVYETFKEDKSLNFISVTSPNDKDFANDKAIDHSQKAIRKVMVDQGINYPVYFDYQNAFSKAYAIKEFPLHIFINSDGKIEQVLTGELTQEQLSNLIKALN